MWAVGFWDPRQAGVLFLNCSFALMQKNQKIKAALGESEKEIGERAA